MRDYCINLLRTAGKPGAATAFTEVLRIYDEVHGRDALDDPGSIGWVSVLTDGMPPEEAERLVRVSAEHRKRSERVVRDLYREVLLRDPGPMVPQGNWLTGDSDSPSDDAALAYVDDYQLGRKSAAEIREDLKASPEYQDRRNGPAGALEVVNFAMVETFPERPAEHGILPGTSLFYAMSPDVSREIYLRTIDALASVGIRMARFAQTFTWDNPPRVSNVIPFAGGTDYRHKGGIDDGRSVSWKPSADHFQELEWRLDQAAARGIHVQYTIFWGGMQPLFTTGQDGKPGHPPGQGGYSVIWERVREYTQFVGRFFKEHQAHTLEIINECDHPHHLARLGFNGRVEFLTRAAKWIREVYPQAVITASDGGHGPRLDGKNTSPAPEGSPYFDYGEVRDLDYWNVHFPRDTVEVNGFPRWCRGSWHLYQDRGPFRQTHPTKGYGRSDENIFLTTEEEHQRWSYRGSTRDWRMYAVSWWVTAMAGAGFTVHNFKGFFCRPNLLDDPIFSQAAKAFSTITKDFAWQGSTPFNAGWQDSPVADYRGPFKVFSIVSGQLGRSVLVTVLDATGDLVLNLDRAFRLKVYEITGETRAAAVVGPGRINFTLPSMAYGKAAILRLDSI